MNKPHFFILGGEDPGIYIELPDIPIGKKQPVFPIKIVCASYEEAQKVSVLQGVLDRLDLSQSATVVAASIVQSEEAKTVLAFEDKFYSVLFGMPSGIYRDYADVEHIFDKSPRKFKKLDSFLDALAYMLTRGQFDTAVALNVLHPPAPIPHTPSRGIKMKMAPSTPNRPMSLLPTKPGHSTLTLTVPPTTCQGTKSPHPGPNHSSSQDPPALSPSPSPTTSVSTKSVYQHVRSLSGIVGSVPMRPAIWAGHDDSIPSLGEAADKYVAAHGYNLASIHHFVHALEISQTVEDFIAYLHPRGMAWTEVVYLWDIIHS